MDVSNISLFGYLNFLVFLSVVLVGFYYEWKIGLLNWVPVQNALQNNNSIFLFVLILAPQIFSDTIKYVRYFYIVAKDYFAQGFNVISLPLHCTAMLILVIIAMVCYKRYIVDIEKQFPFTNPYQFAKAELAIREDEMRQLETQVRGGIFILCNTLVIWIGFKVWPVLHEGKNIFIYFADIWYKNYYNEWKNPVPHLKIDLRSTDFVDATTFQTLRASRAERLPAVFEYAALVKNENLLSPMDARYTKISTLLANVKHLPPVLNCVEQIGEYDGILRGRGVLEKVPSEWSLPTSLENIFAGAMVQHTIDRQEWHVVHPEEVYRIAGQRLEDIWAVWRMYPKLTEHVPAYEKMRHLMMADYRELKVISKFYKYFYNQKYYKYDLSFDNLMEQFPQAIRKMPKASHMEIMEHIGFPYSVGYYGQDNHLAQAPEEVQYSFEMMKDYLTLPMHNFRYDFYDYDEWDGPILAILVFLVSSVLLEKVYIFCYSNFKRSGNKILSFFNYSGAGGWNSKSSWLSLRFVVVGAIDYDSEFRFLSLIFLKCQESLAGLIIHAEWYHILFPPFMFLFLMLIGYVMQRYPNREPNGKDGEIYMTRRLHHNGRNVGMTYIGKLKFFVITSFPDLLVEETFTQNSSNLLFQKFFLFTPELIIGFGLFLVLLWTGRSLFFLQGVVINIFRACFVSLFITLWYVAKMDYRSLSILDGAYQISLWSQCVKILVLILAVFFIIYFDLGELVPNEFMKFLIIFILLAFILASNRSFFLLLISLEGISLLAYVTAAAEKSYGGIAAAVKYFSIGALGSVLLFWSAVHMYPATMHMSYENIFMFARLYESQNFETLEIIEFFSTLLTFGITIKLGVAPFHQWIADLYAGTSVYINAVFAILIKVIVFFSVFEVLCNLLCDILFKFTLIYSLVLGCYFSLKQNEVRRLIAYSSIVHTSFLLIGDALVSITYMLTYICSNILFFTSLMMYEKLEGDESTWLNDLGNFNKYGYFNVTALVVSLFSMMGLPPFAGFFGKVMVWISLIEDFYFYNELYSYVFFITSILLSIIIAFYYIKIIMYIFAVKEEGFILIANTEFSDLGIKLLKPKLFVQYLSLYFVVTWVFWHEDIITLVLFLITDLC